jgi:hypothetical protein
MSASRRKSAISYPEILLYSIRSAFPFATNSQLMNCVIEDSRQKADCCLVVLSAENFLIGEGHDHLPTNAAKTIIVVNKMLAISIIYC